MKRRGRTRPACLSDDVLSAAANAGVTRLLQHRSFNLNESKGMTNVRELVNIEVALQKKATWWIHKQLVEENKVTIQQLASTLRVNKAKAVEVMTFMIKGITDVPTLGNMLRIFVVNGFIPDWLRDQLNPYTQSAVRQEAGRSRRSTLERDVHRKVLADVYGATFKDVLAVSYRRAYRKLFNALVETGLVDEVPPCNLGHFDQLTSSDWAIDRRCGRAGLAHYVRLPGNSTVHIHFGNYTPEELDKINLVNRRQLRQVVHNSEYSAAEIASLKEKLETVMEAMRLAGYGVLKVTALHLASPADAGTRTVVVFADKSDIGLTISFSTPWPNVIFN